MIRTLLCGSFLWCLSTVQAHTLNFCYESADETPHLHKLQIGDSIVEGFHAAVTADALQQLALPYTLHRLPWRRCLAEAERGQMDGAIGVGWTAQRTQQFHFPWHDGQTDSDKRLTYVNYYIYTHRASTLQWDGETLTGMINGLAAPRGYIVENKLAQLNALRPLDAGAAEALALVLNQRLDGYVMPAQMAELHLSGHPLAAQLRKLEPVFLRQDLFLAISKSSNKLDDDTRARLWQQIAESRTRLFNNPPLVGSDLLR